MGPEVRTSGSDRGAVLVHVAVALLGLTAFTTFVADYGLLWVSRRQAQNAADSGAMAGATALAYDNNVDLTDTGPAKTSAYWTSQANLVWGLPPNVNITSDITFPTTLTECPTFPDSTMRTCVRVDVYRNQARGNPLPMLFGSIVGLTQQGVRATATAAYFSGNASDCLKPWGVADKWDERQDPTWMPTSTFDPTATPPDDYVRQGEYGPNEPGTGFKGPDANGPNDLGVELFLKVGSPGDTINPGWFQALDLSGAADSTCTNGGANCYRSAISTCAGGTWGIGDEVPKQNGNMTGPTNQGARDLIDLDPSANWDPVNKKIINSCVGPPYTCSQPGFVVSPRLVAIPVFDLEKYIATGGPGNGTVEIVNILGFFVDRIVSGDVVGYLVTKKDLKVGTKGSMASGASFLKVVQLIR